LWRNKDYKLGGNNQMKCIILAGGYATRLYPLTKDKPKSLLEVGGITILEHILKKVEKVESIDYIYIVSNDRFYSQFVDWVKKYKSSKEIKVLNDLTTSNKNRLGAIADIKFTIGNENIEDDILVMAGDNLFDFELKDFEMFYREIGNDCITVYELNDKEGLKRTGVVEIDNNSKVISFEEKPKEPKSNLAVPPFYIYRKDTLEFFDKYISEGNNPDAPGLLPWLIKHKDVYAFKFKGMRYDIGTLESYERVKGLFKV
jgi:glucose-1-phosphate thymidylyltransferase